MTIIKIEKFSFSNTWGYTIKGVTRNTIVSGFATAAEALKYAKGKKVVK